MNKDKELMLMQRELDRAYDKLVDIEYENAMLKKKIEEYEWKATIEAWDEAWAEEWIAEHQLSLPFNFSELEIRGGV